MFLEHAVDEWQKPGYHEGQFCVMRKGREYWEEAPGFHQAMRRCSDYETAHQESFEPGIWPVRGDAIAVSSIVRRALDMYKLIEKMSGVHRLTEGDYEMAKAIFEAIRYDQGKMK